MEKHNQNLDIENEIKQENEVEMTKSFETDVVKIEDKIDTKKERKKLDKKQKKLEKVAKAEFAKLEKATKKKQAAQAKIEKAKEKEEAKIIKADAKAEAKTETDEIIEVNDDVVVNETITTEETVNIEISDEISIDQDGNVEETLNVEIKEDIDILEEINSKDIVKVDPNETELTRVIKRDLNVGKTEKEVREKRKRALRFKPTASTILLLLIMIFAALSWFLGGQSYILEDNEVVNIPNQRYGLFDILRFLEDGFIRDIGGIWFLLIASGAMGVFIRTGALQALMQKMKKSKFFTPRKSLVIVMISISLITTMFNANYLLVALAVFVVPLLVFNGYDILTALMALLFASAAGQMSSIFNGELIIKWIDAMNSSFEDGGGAVASIADGLVFRSIVFILFTVTSIVVVSNYGDKVLSDFTSSSSRRETSKFIQTGSVIFGNKGKENMTTRKKVILFSFAFTLIISIIGVVQWHKFGFTALYDMSSKWSDEGHFMRIIWGTDMKPLGNWTYLEISYMFILFSILVATMSYIPQRKYLQGMTRGMNTTLNIVLILTLSGTLFALLEESGLHYTIFYSTLNFFQETFGNIGVPIGAFLSSIVYSVAFPMTHDLMEIIASIMPRIIIDMSGPTFEFVMFVGTSITIGAGLISIILPTSAITIGLIWAYKIPYNKWLISVWKPLLQFAAVSAAMIVAFTLLLV